MQLRAISRQRERLRTPRHCIGDFDLTAARTGGRRSERNCYGTGGSGCQGSRGDRTGVGLGEISGIGAGHLDAGDAKRRAARVANCDGLRVALVVHHLIPKCDRVRENGNHRKVEQHGNRVGIGVGHRDIGAAIAILYLP